MLLKPRFGKRMCSGICPPSKPLMLTPERAFAPFCPRPAVLPLPEPMPRPTRMRPFQALLHISAHHERVILRLPSHPGLFVGTKNTYDRADLRTVVEGKVR